MPIFHSKKVMIPVALFVIFSGNNALAQHQKLGMEGANPVERGRTLFDWVWEPTTLPRAEGRSDGLGPMFNARSCAECHHQGGTGGSGSVDHNIDIITVRPASLGDNSFPAYAFNYSFRIVNGRFEYQFGNGNQNVNNQTNKAAGQNQIKKLDPVILAGIHEGFRHSPSVVLHKFSTDKTYRDYRRSIPGRHDQLQVDLAERNTPSLFGTGLIDKINEKDILTQASRQRSLGLTGRVARTADGRIGKFGWKAQKATLREFVEEAAASELGLETENKSQGADPRGPADRAPGVDLSQDQIDSFTAFVASLTRPESQADEQTKSGQRLFRDLDCAKCHVPNLGGIEGLYSDMLLHDMKPELRESGEYEVFGTSRQTEPIQQNAKDDPTRSDEWRTAPLWGIRNSAPYMHDGHAPTLSEAILDHGGEAQSSARKFLRLSESQKSQLIQFLKTL